MMSVPHFQFITTFKDDFTFQPDRFVLSKTPPTILSKRPHLHFRFTQKEFRRLTQNLQSTAIVCHSDEMLIVFVKFLPTEKSNTFRPLTKFVANACIFNYLPSPPPLNVQKNATKCELHVWQQYARILALHYLGVI